MVSLTSCLRGPPVAAVGAGNPSDDGAKSLLGLAKEAAAAASTGDGVAEACPLTDDKLDEHQRAAKSVENVVKVWNSMARPVQGGGNAGFPNKVFYARPCGLRCPRNYTQRQTRMYSETIAALCQVVAKFGSPTELACQDVVLAVAVHQSRSQGPFMFDFINPVWKKTAGATTRRNRPSSCWSLLTLPPSHYHSTARGCDSHGGRGSG
jgi:hypothetical protein